VSQTPAPRGRRPRRTSSGWVIGRLAGAPVVVTPSWFVAAAVLTVLFAPTVRFVAPDLGIGTYVVALAFVLLLFLSVFLHEAAHALVARARGHEVHELALTLWGGHTAYGGGGGPLDAFLVAVVGPVTNLALAAAFWGVFQPVRHDASIAGLLLYAGAFSNAFVGIFNLLPGLPLDGGQMLESAVWGATGNREKGTVAAGWVGRLVALAVIAWVVLWPLGRGEQPSLTTVIWGVLIGGFLWQGASQAVASGRARAAVAHLRAADLMLPVRLVYDTGTVADARAVSLPHHALVVVDHAGTAVGAVDPQALGSVPDATAATTPVSAVAQTLGPDAIVDADTAGGDLVGTVAEAAPHAPVLAVMHAGSVVGLLPVQTVVDAVRRANTKPA
jgi:Zn-dependent protease